MSKRIAISFKELAPRIIGPLGEYRPARIQNFEVRGNFPSRDIQEHGNPYNVGVDVDIPEYTVTLEALDVSVKLFAALTGTADPYPGTGVSINNLYRVEVVGDVKDATAMEYVKSIYIHKAYVQSFRFSYSVDGDSTEEYTFGGNARTVFSKNVVVDTFTTGTSPQTLSETPVALKSGKKAICVTLDGEYLTEVASAPGETEYSITGNEISFGGTISSALVVAYKAEVAGDTWENIKDDSIPVVITGKHVPVLLKANQIPRVQSVTVNGTLRADPIKEQGNREIVGYVYQIPEVTGDITVLDTDNELVALFSTGDMDSEDDEFTSCELLTERDIALEIQLLNPADPCAVSGTTVVKTVYIPKIVLTGESYTSNVGDNVTLTFPYRAVTGDVIVYSGARA